MKLYLRKPPYPLSVLATAILTSQSAIADTKTQALERTQALETVYVTGEILDRDLQEASTSIAVLDEDDLARSSDRDIYDVIERIPNVTSAFGNKGFTIRGIDQRGASGGGNSLLVNYSVDGASLPNNQASFFGPYSAWDIKQIEVLRGPQSTQQGRNSLAGAIVVESNDPELDQVASKMRVRLGNYDTKHHAFMLNLPLVEDTLAFRLAAENNSTEGWVKNPTRQEDDFDARELSMLRVKLLFAPNESFSALLTHNHTHNEGGEDYVSQADFPDNRYNFSSEDSTESSRHRFTTLELNWDVNENLTLSASSNYYTHDYERFEDTDSSPLPLAALDRSYDDKSFSQELRAKYNAEDFTTVLGLYYYDLDTDITDTFSQALSPVAIGQRFQNLERTGENMAFYTETDWHFADNWRLSTGLRYDRENYTAGGEQSYSANVPSFIQIPLPPAADGNFDAWLPKLGLTYFIDEDQNISGTIQRAYRAGGYSRSAVTLTGGEYDPEYAINYELAYRSQWFEQRLSVNANLFHMDWKDQQAAVRAPVQAPPGLPANLVKVIEGSNIYTTNIGESTLTGFEVSADWMATSTLNLFAALGYSDTELKKFTLNGEDLAGNRFTNASKYTGSLGFDWQASYNWRFGANFSARSDAYSTVYNKADAKVAGYGLLNLKGSYEQENWAINAYVRNALDKDFLTQRNDSLARTGEPRLYGLEFVASL